jgi:hypothetical protein
MTSGRWVAGAYAAEGFASGYPERDDVLLRPVVDVDEVTGEFVLDENRELVTRDRTLYVNGAEIEYFEFTDG